MILVTRTPNNGPQIVGNPHLAVLDVSAAIIPELHSHTGAKLIHGPTVDSKKLEYGCWGPEYGSNRVLIWNYMVEYLLQ